MSKIDQLYKSAIKEVLEKGVSYKDPERPNVSRLQIPSYSMYVPAEEDFAPILTSKHVSLKNVVGELLWFLRGETELTFLHQNNIHIWDKDFDRYIENGHSLPAKAYGYYWRNYQGVDQVKQMADTLMYNIWSTRNIIETWNPSHIKNKEVVLPPCHKTIQAVATSSSSFEFHIHQRSADVFLGVPYNILSYYSFGRAMEIKTGMKYDGALMNFSCFHLYDNAIKSAMRLLAGKEHAAPRMLINPNIDIVNDPFSITTDDFKLVDYKYDRKYKVEMR
jgi:thymidylate synthase